MDGLSVYQKKNRFRENNEKFRKFFIDSKVNTDETVPKFQFLEQQP
jgi:hypothetical protein